MEKPVWHYGGSYQMEETNIMDSDMVKWKTKWKEPHAAVIYTCDRIQMKQAKAGSDDVR